MNGGGGRLQEGSSARLRGGAPDRAESGHNQGGLGWGYRKGLRLVKAMCEGSRKHGRAAGG
eukprot:6214459-Pleurochrysis_carterae.AAC.1